MELASCHPSGAYNFEATLRVLESLCTAVLGLVSHRYGVLINLRQAPGKSTQRLYIRSKREVSP